MPIPAEVWRAAQGWASFRTSFQNTHRKSVVGRGFLRNLRVPCCCLIGHLKKFGSNLPREVPHLRSLSPLLSSSLCLYLLVELLTEERLKSQEKSTKIFERSISISVTVTSFGRDIIVTLKEIPLWIIGVDIKSLWSVWFSTVWKYLEIIVRFSYSVVSLHSWMLSDMIDWHSVLSSTLKYKKRRPQCTCRFNEWLQSKTRPSASKSAQVYRTRSPIL